MNTREKILEAVLKNQPPAKPLPDISFLKGNEQDPVEKFKQVFAGIGGKVFTVDSLEAIKDLVRANFDTSKRLITTLPELTGVAELLSPGVDPHSFDDVELALIQASFSVGENGAVWFNETLMGQRIVPYICQHLAAVIYASTIVSTMHEAYEKIGSDQYGFGSFIGGPSKTADIEQALVMGAHGPITMTVFVVTDGLQ
ncbi:MAG: LUD domain-containing protein [Chitinophagaceae bacterium]